MLIDGHEYRFSKLNAIKQWNVVRRVAPALVGVLGLATLADLKDKKLGIQDLISRMEPFLQALGKLSDDDNNYVIDTLLATVEREVEGGRGWQKVGSSSALMFEDDIDLLVMLRLVFEAGRENLLGFFAAFQRMYPDLLGTTEE